MSRHKEPLAGGKKQEITILENILTENQSHLLYNLITSLKKTGSNFGIVVERPDGRKFVCSDYLSIATRAELILEEFERDPLLAEMLYLVVLEHIAKNSTGKTKEFKNGK